MKDLRFKRNPSNGRQGFTWDSRNDVVFDSNEGHAVMACLVEARGKWWADVNGTHGSNLTLVKTITATTKSDAEAYSREALADLVKAGRIAINKIVVTLPDSGQRGRLDVIVYWSSRGGPEQTARIFF